MKKIFVIICLLALLPLHYSSATVGGSSTISDVYYLASTNSIRYLYNLGGESGCLPEVKELSLQTQKISTLLSCAAQDPFDPKVGQKRQAFFKDGIKLQQVDLTKLGINFQVNFKDATGIYLNDGLITPFKLDEENFWNVPDFIFNWQATATQNGKTKQNFIVPMCYKYNKINFAGLGYPGKNLLAVITTGLSSCFETGYTDDHIYALNNIELPKEVFIGEYIQKPNIITNTEKVAGDVLTQFPLDKLLYYVNDAGFKAYSLGMYPQAIYLFENAYTENYLLPLYNLAATEAKTDQLESALGHIKQLLDYNNDRTTWIKKIIADPDFNSIRNNPQYLQDVSAPANTNSSANIDDKDLNSNVNLNSNNLALKDANASSNTNSLRTLYLLVILSLIISIISALIVVFRKK